jgi:hypothetical protein
MFILMRDSLATPEQCYQQGESYEVTDAHGTYWIRCGKAVPTTQPPRLIAELLSRLDLGAGQTALFLPFVGEFGHLCMSHLRIVHFNRATTKIVCCRKGQEVLFPSADSFVTDWTDPIPDRLRCGTIRDKNLDWSDITNRFPDAVPVRPGGLTLTQELHAIAPNQPIPFLPRLRGLRADVVIGTRSREFCPEKNWTHWDQVAEALHAEALTIAVIGDRATSHDVRHQLYHSGDFDTDASIELLQNCRLYLGTDTGSAHLAATVGSRMAVLRIDQPHHRDLRPRMEAVNPGRVAMLPPRAWSDPSEVIAATLNTLDAARQTSTSCNDQHVYADHLIGQR